MKELLADRDLEIDCLKGSAQKLVSAPQKKSAVEHLVEIGKCSQRQACRFVGLSRSTSRYPMRRVVDRIGDEALLVERLHKFAVKRWRRGYRLAHQELRRDGFIVNHKRVYRLWKEQKLNVRPRRSRKRIQGVGVPRLVTAGQPNAVWCSDFLQDNTLGEANYAFCASATSSPDNPCALKWAARLGVNVFAEC